MLVEHLVMAVDLAAVAVDRIGQLLRCGELEVHRLAGIGPDAAGDEEQPGQQFRPVGRAAGEAAGFLGEIEEDRAGIENAGCLAAAARGKIGKAACRERGGQYVWISVVAWSL